MLELSREARDALLGDIPRGVLRIGTLESTAASRLPALLTRYHDKYPGVRVELTSGTTGALVEAVSTRRLEAAFVADCAAAGPLDAMAAFQEELVVIAPSSHPLIRRAQDVRTDSLISFAKGCAYRERLQAWLGTGGGGAEKVLELSSYHAIIACVAAGAGIAVVPRSVLATIRLDSGVAVYPLAAKMGKSTTSLVWRKGEGSVALAALQAEVMAVRKSKQRGSASR